MLTRHEQDSHENITPVYQKVLATFTTHPGLLYHLTIRTDSGDEEVLSTTGNHPFYVIEQQKFIDAEELTLGATLSLPEGRTARIIKIESEKADPGDTFTTYNLCVEETHTYFVGESGVWVHNETGARCELAAKEISDALREISDPSEALAEVLAGLRRLRDKIEELPKTDYRKLQLYAKHAYDTALELLLRGEDGAGIGKETYKKVLANLMEEISPLKPELMADLARKFNIPMGELKEIFEELRNKAADVLAEMMIAWKTGKTEIVLHDKTLKLKPISGEDDGSGPVLTILKDRTTGEIFLGQNYPEARSPWDGLHGLAERMISDYRGAGNPPFKAMVGAVGQHAEYDALSQAAFKRNLPKDVDPRSVEGDFLIFNVRALDSKANSVGMPMARCKVCKGSLLDVVVGLTDHVKTFK
ncbi:Hypothetical protein PBC10988_3630 [Planctomycetales bacterium 10988]|nr:Hypothetical protein PBC10988_3630 [Planctomycetales bacterium 10988]